MKTEQIYELVIDVLSKSIDARNDDKVLIFEVLKLTGAEFSEKDNAILIKQSKLGDLPSFESIRRVRQKIQNGELRFLPTWGNALVKRGFTDDVVRSMFGDQSNVYQNYIFIKTEGMRLRSNIQVATL